MRTLTAEQRSRGAQNDIIFDEMREYCGLREGEIFRRASAPEGSLTMFLHNVWICPESVLEFCRKALAPGSPERLAYAECLATKGVPG